MPEISRLSKTLHFSYTPLWKSIVFNVQQPLHKNLKKRNDIRIYLSTEKELRLLYIAKHNTSEFKDPDYESESAILTLAIGRAAGNSLHDIEDDVLFQQQIEMLKKKYTKCYYKTAYAYKLPTMRIVPFIVRLIT